MRLHKPIRSLPSPDPRQISPNQDFPVSTLWMPMDAGISPQDSQYMQGSQGYSPIHKLPSRLPFPQQKFRQMPVGYRGCAGEKAPLLSRLDTASKLTADPCNTVISTYPSPGSNESDHPWCNLLQASKPCPNESNEQSSVRSSAYDSPSTGSFQLRLPESQSSPNFERCGSLPRLLQPSCPL